MFTYFFYGESQNFLKFNSNPFTQLKEGQVKGE